MADRGLADPAAKGGTDEGPLIAEIHLRVVRANSFARGLSDGQALAQQHRQTSLAVPPGYVWSLLC